MFGGVWHRRAPPLRLSSMRREHTGREASQQTRFSAPEVLMSGRRSHPRYAVATPWDGAMRVLRDVVILRSESDELHAVSHVPGISGEEMTLDLIGAGSTLGLKVKVIDSRPMMVEGAVRHRIRLAVKSGDAETAASERSEETAMTARAQVEAL